MKKIFKKLTLFYVIMVILFLTVSLSGCSDGFVSDYEWSENSFSLEVTADRTDVRFGEEVTIITTFRNLSGRNLNLYVDATPGSAISWSPYPNSETRDFTKYQIWQTFLNMSPWELCWYTNRRDYLYTFAPRFNFEASDRMEYFTRFRLEKDAVFKQQITIRFLYFWNLPQNWYQLQPTIIPHSLNYITSSMSRFYTSRIRSSYNKITLVEHIQFNIITEEETYYE